MRRRAPPARPERSHRSRWGRRWVVVAARTVPAARPPRRPGRARRSAAYPTWLPHPARADSPPADHPTATTSHRIPARTASSVAVRAARCWLPPSARTVCPGCRARVRPGTSRTARGRRRVFHSAGRCLPSVAPARCMSNTSGPPSSPPMACPPNARPSPCHTTATGGDAEWLPHGAGAGRSGRCDWSGSVSLRGAPSLVWTGTTQLAHWLGRRRQNGTPPCAVDAVIAGSGNRCGAAVSPGRTVTATGWVTGTAGGSATGSGWHSATGNPRSLRHYSSSTARMMTSPSRRRTARPTR